MKQLLIYEQPIALNRDQHRDVRLRAAPMDFAFARTLNSVPLTTVEFGNAARDYPIVFAGTPDNAGMPAALLGLSREQNLFVQHDGNWAQDTYVPAFVRRYPFVVANQDSASGFTVCVDKPFISDNAEGVALFEASGADAPALTRALHFLGEYQRAVEQTTTFMQQVREFKLLVDKTVNIERPGSDRQTLNGFCVVDEARLQKLSGRALAQLSRTGTLGLLYVHLMSLGNIQRLSARMDARPHIPLH